MSEDMIILTRTFDLLDGLLPKSERFPKAYRFTMTQRMMDAALDFQEALFDALSQGGTTRQTFPCGAAFTFGSSRRYSR